MKRGGVIGILAAGFGRGEIADQAPDLGLTLLRLGKVLQLGVEDGVPDEVAFGHGDLRETNRGVGRKIEFAERADAGAHQPAAVEQDHEALVALRLIMPGDQAALCARRLSNRCAGSRRRVDAPAATRIPGPRRAKESSAGRPGAIRRRRVRDRSSLARRHRAAPIPRSFARSFPGAA